MSDQSAPSDFDSLYSFALNDVVHEAEWLEDEDYQVHFSARYAGASADGTIYFRMRRNGQRVPDQQDTNRLSLAAVALNVPGIPIFWEVRVPLWQRRGKQLFGTAAWRHGPGPDDIELRFYTLSDSGVLVEINKPAEVTERPVGFRASLPVDE